MAMKTVVSSIFAWAMVVTALSAATAQTNVAGPLLQALQASSQVQSNCPDIGSVSIGDPSDKTTWSVGFASTPNEFCNAIIADLIANFSEPPTSMQVVSSSIPALNGTYPIDPGTQQNVQAISLYIAVNHKFPAGVTAMPFPDTNGVYHSFPSTAEWQAFASAMGDFVTKITLGQPVFQPVAIP